MQKVFLKITLILLIFVFAICYPFLSISSTNATYVWSNLGASIEIPTAFTQNER